MMDELVRLIELIPTAPWMARVTTPEEVREIVNFGHVHVRRQIGMPEWWREAVVITPDHMPDHKNHMPDHKNHTHTVQLVYISKDDWTCHCWDCNGQCPAAIAAFLVNWQEFVLPKIREEETCSVCGEPLTSHNHKTKEIVEW